MQLLEKAIKTPATAEGIDAYIGAVMHELYYPFFLHEKVRDAIREFLYREFDFDKAIAETADDALRYRIGEPRAIAESFAEKCKYVWLRGSMQAWKKHVIAAALIILVIAAGLFVFHVYDQWNFNRGYWSDGSAKTTYAPATDLYPEVQVYK